MDIQRLIFEIVSENETEFTANYIDEVDMPDGTVVGIPVSNAVWPLHLKETLLKDVHSFKKVTDDPIPFTS